MPLKKCSGRVDLGGAPIAEVKGWDASHAAAEEDTTIINNGCATRTSTGAVSYSLSLNVYQDPTDASQNALIEGASGLEITIYPAGNITGMAKRVYSDCTVLSFADSGGPTGFLEANLSIKANGGCARSVVA